MFRTFPRPSSGAQWLQWQLLVLASYRGDSSSAVFVVGPAGPTTNTARISPRYEGKTRGCNWSHWAPDDGREKSETCWAVNKRQDNKLKIYCIRMATYLNCTMMHGLTNLKFYIYILAHSVCKMRIMHEPQKSALWNKRHLEEKKRRVCSMFKIISTYSCWKKYIKWNI
jgi:hypothetical protein